MRGGRPTARAHVEICSPRQRPPPLSARISLLHDVLAMGWRARDRILIAPTTRGPCDAVHVSAASTPRAHGSAKSSAPLRASLHTLAYPECAEHFSVLVYSGRLTRHCPRLLHPCNPRHDDRARRRRRRRRGHGPAVRRDVQVGGELVARTHGRGGAPACTQQCAQLERDACSQTIVPKR
jgi:hypothetical protein